MFWIDELRDSLLRAGDHIAPEVEVHNWVTEEGDHYLYKLWHVIPKDSQRYVTNYIKLFGKANDWRVKKVVHKKFSIEIIAEPLL